jgi:hypothetical protein
MLITLIGLVSRRRPGKYAAVLAAVGLGAGLLLATTPAAGAATKLPRPSGLAAQTLAGRPSTSAAPASLMAAIHRSLGTSASPSAVGYCQQAELTGSDTAAGDDFGFSVALSALGTTALVGAYQHNKFTGAAYVFTLQGGTWSQTAELTASDATADDEFGISVALSALGTTALVGAFERHSEAGAAQAGAAYVFRLQGGTWSQTAELTDPDGAAEDFFGRSVALSALGTTALVGAYGVNSFTGAAYVYTLQGGTWSQTGELTASDATAGNALGISVALSALGNTALVGSFASNSFTGAAYVFRLQGGTWSQTAELTASDATAYDQFGWSVALSALGTTALVGAYGVNTTGAAYVFTLQGGTWSQTAELTASDATEGGEFGISVALSALGTTTLVGGTYAASSAGGAAYVFTGCG